MEEETENNISEGFDDNDDLLIGSIGGVDDEGIVNFLSDAIGQDVGTEVLREFSHSEAFAELLDVVTSSLIPSGATSRRESNQDSETTPDGVVDPNQSERIQVIPDGNEQLETVRSSQNPNTDKKASEEKVSNPLEDEDPKSCSRNTDETKGTASPSDRKIHNRLKICLKTPVGGKKDKKPPKTKAVLKLIHPPDETTTMPDQSSHKNSPEIQQTKEITEKSVKTKKAYVKSIHRLHKKCMLVHCDKEFRKYSTMLKLNPCCVILCDLLSMGSAFRETNCLGGGGDASLSFVSVKNLVVISEENIDETHAAEEMKRKYFVKKLNPLKEDNTVHVSKSQLNEIAQHTDKLMNTAPQQSSTKTSDSVKKQDQNKEVQDLGTTIVNKVVSFDESKTKKTSKMNEVKITEVNLEDDDDDEEEEEELPRPIKSRHKSGDRHTRGLETEATSSTEYDAKDKSQFGRQRDKDDVRARKFDKFEYERKRKLTEKTGEKIKKEVKVVLKPEDPFKHGKTFTNSFKIPKKNTYDNYLKPDELKVSTPLAKQEIPRENLKFERFKKGLGEDKDSNAKKRDWIPRNKRFENRTKMDYDMPHSSDNKPQQLPQSDVLLEMEKTWEDEPEGEGSIFGDRSTDSPLPPLSEVQAGDLAVEVTELLRDGLKTEVPSMEDFSCATDSTAQKCAWWFTKAEKEPPSEGDCHMQNLEAAPSFSSDNGSNCSFVGNVSNPGTDDADCQVNEISSTNRCDLVSERVRDPDKVDEYCGRSLLQAKIRIGGGDSFQNIFDLRSGALYEKENFQAKCNLCNQLIIGRRELAVHVRGVSHKNKLRKTDPEMAKADDLLPATSAKTSVKIEAKCDEDLVDKIKNIKKDSIDKDEEKFGDAKNGKKEKDFQDKKSVKEEKDQNDKKHKDKSKRNGKKDKERDESVSVKKEPVEMVYSRTSTGLAIKVPAMTSNSGSKLRSRTRSPLSQTRSKSRNRSGTRSRSRERKRRKSRSPVRRIPRSPTQFMRNSRRSRSRSPSHRRSRSPSHRRSRSRSRTPPRGSRKRRSSSEDKVKAFLARTRRSRSPANGYYSKRNRRSRTRSRSPQIAMKKDNREFHEKLALTADGKWNDEMEKRWKLMEADEAMFREQFYDHRKALIASPEEHSKYGEEWRQFWERRYQEVEQAGKDPDSYDYVTEWKEYWSKRLNSLLQDEADAKILQIKKTYGMDFASLNKLRNGNVSSAPTASAKTIVKTEVIEPKIEPKVPQSIPSGVKREAVDNVKAPGSGSDRLSLDDFGTKSMSISSGDFETDKNKDIKKPPERKPSVTVEDFKSKWELLTRQKVEEIAGSSLTDGLNIIPERQDSTNRILEKIENAAGSVISKRRPSKNRSEVTSSSEASYDFDGFDLVQVLRLMCKLEDQLSFLAPKVLEYFKMAEEMELAKSRGSHILLDNEELVTVLFQSRDRFMTMIRSNIVSKDVLKSLNLTVYALNAILDAPQCQKFRLNVPIMMIELEKPAPAATTLTTEIKEPEVLLPKIHQEKIEDKPAPVQTGSGVCHDIVAALINVPLEKKLSAASMITKFLLSHGRQSSNISDKALTDFVRTLLAPILQSARGNAESKASMDHHNQFRRNSAAGSKEFDIQQPPRYVAETLLNELESHSASSRLHGVTGSRVVGSALPALHSMSARAVEQHQRAPASYVEHHANEYDVYRTGSNTVPPKATSRQSPSPSGRRSPFSRRDYTGNPAANRGRL